MLEAYFTWSIAAVEKKDNANFDELIMFLKKHRSSMCLIARVADNLINFQAVVKKGLSEFELLKCCCRISNRDHRETS